MNRPQPLANIRVVLSHTTHPGNIGAAARAMKTMGLRSLYLVRPRHYPDPQATALAAGAADVLDAATLCDSLQAALAEVVLAVGVTARKRDLSHPMLSARAATPRILDTAAQFPVALVFGTEMSGLSNAELDLCQLLLTIPAAPDYPSLNLGAAVQVIGYELRQALPELALPPEIVFPPATVDDLEGLFAHMETVLLDSGFLNPRQPKLLMRRLRRLFARAGLEKEEVNILRGILASLSK
jgi:tRNA/rRNA methyltransferase